jgi:peptidoglycan/xylan/chitin deacetylase (PgdA/CDA1 family)
MKITILRVAKLFGLFALMRIVTGRGIRILCYHGIWLGKEGFGGDAMFMSRTVFESRLDLIQRLCYPVVALSAAVDALDRRARVPSGSVVITIDDGWYSAFAVMLPALRKRSMPATLYCDTAHLQSEMPVAHVMAHYLRRLTTPTGHCSAVEATFARATDRARPFVERMTATHELSRLLGAEIEPYIKDRVFDYMTRAELVEAANAGLDVQLHTHNHSLHDFTPAKISREIDENRRTLAALLGRDPESFRHFCYPSGITSPDAAKALEQIGLASSTTTRYGIAWPSSPRQMLPRILDDEHITPIEFEAELCGVGHLLRATKRLIGALQSTTSGQLAKFES